MSASSTPTDRDALRRGIANLDDQHAQIASLAREAEYLARAGYTPALHRLLNELSLRLKEHFDDEEALLEALDYEQLAHHSEAHLALIENLAELLMGVTRGAVAALDVQRFISSQLTAHFLSGDAAVDSFFQRVLHHT